MGRESGKNPRYRITEPLRFSDQIAFDQFLLATERNFLLHVSTGLNMTVVGLAMFRFFSRNSNDLYGAVGVAAFVIAGLIVAKGTVDYLKMRKDLSLMKEEIREFRDDRPDS